MRAWIYATSFIYWVQMLACGYAAFMGISFLLVGEELLGALGEASRTGGSVFFLSSKIAMFYLIALVCHFAVRQNLLAILAANIFFTISTIYFDSPWWSYTWLLVTVPPIIIIIRRIKAEAGA